MKSFVAILLIAALSGPALAQNAGKDLKRIESELDKGRTQRDALKQQALDYGRQLAGLKSDMVKAAAAIQGHEADALALQDRLGELTKAEAQKASHLQSRRGQFMHVLMALQRMAARPPEAMIAAPQSPSDMIRGAILLRTVVPQIERQAAILRQDLSGLIEARTKTQARRRDLSLAVRGLSDTRRRLEKLMTEKSLLKSRANAASRKAERRVRNLAGKAKDLRDLLARLETERRRQAAAAPTTPKIKPKNRPILKARGNLPFPAIGRLVGRYGQMTETGMTRKGITIETRSGAQVVAPYGGQVMFAGAFKGYGQLLIIEHGEGYHSLLAGLARIDSVIGQQILSGEPAGIMGGGEGEAPVLYVELRRNGQPINPLPWLAARKSKVNG